VGHEVARRGSLDTGCDVIAGGRTFGHEGGDLWVRQTSALRSKKDRNGRGFRHNEGPTIPVSWASKLEPEPELVSSTVRHCYWIHAQVRACYPCLEQLDLATPDT
jgi:hypothetical protein